MKPARGFRPAKRLSGFGTSVFTEISRLAVEHGAVNLGQGFPDFAAPDFVKEAAARHIREERNQYAASAGAPRLRAALGEHWQWRRGRTVDPETEITVASGATEVLFDAILSVVDPGDEVVVFEPCYDAYVPATQMAGGTARYVRLRPPHWDFDPAELRAAFGPRTRALVINTPHNPTGKVFRADELALIAELCCEHDVTAIADEVYSELTYGTANHLSLCDQPGMWDRTITVESMGKMFSVTGWKLGWAVAPEPLGSAIRAVHQFVTFASATPFQHALADALGAARGNGYFDRLRAEYTSRKDILARVLTEVGLPPLATQGSYFHMVDVGKLGFADDGAFCRNLITEHGVAAIPTSVFYGDPRTAPPFARFCFAKSDQTMREGAERLARMASRVGLRKEPTGS